MGYLPPPFVSGKKYPKQPKSIAPEPLLRMPKSATMIYVGCTTFVLAIIASCLWLGLIL